MLGFLVMVLVITLLFVLAYLPWHIKDKRAVCEEQEPASVCS